jgi:hypothetical protein
VATVSGDLARTQRWPLNYLAPRSLVAFRDFVDAVFAEVHAGGAGRATIDYGCDLCDWRTLGTSTDEIVGAWTTHLLAHGEQWEPEPKPRRRWRR